MSFIKVLVFGTFDILHPGHLSFLTQAKRQGDTLTVVVTRDAMVKLQKKHAPIFNERERMKVVGALKMVDRVLRGDPPGRWTIIRREKPDVICVGYDQDANHSAMKSLSKKPHIITLEALNSKRYSSSKIKNKSFNFRT